MDVNSVKLSLGVTSALLHGTAYLLYNLQTRKGESNPRAASWGVWALLAVVNAISYKEMTADWYSALQFFMGSVGCFLTFVYVWSIGRLGRPQGKEWGDFAIGIIATLLLLVFKASDWASLLILIGFVISFRPTFNWVKANPSKEKPVPWAIWTVAFAVTIINKCIGVANPNATELGTILGFTVPIVLLLAHGSIAVLSRSSRREA